MSADNVTSPHTARLTLRGGGPPCPSSGGDSGSGAQNKSGSSPSNPTTGGSNTPNNSNNNNNNNNNPPSNVAGHVCVTGARAPKIRRVMLTRGRVGRSMLVSSRPLIPASSVPEELITEAQAVLQGKPREVILRELQRTNCDVNQAVNNLLSREDDNECDDADENADSYLPEELISLLDTTVVDNQNVIINTDSLYADDLWSLTVRRRVHDKTSAEAKANENQKETGASSCPVPVVSIDFDNVIEMWLSVSPEERTFRAIGAMHSELVAVDTNGVLCQWRWDDPQPPTSPVHPKSAKLGLTCECVKSIACSNARSTVLTVSCKVACFVDESLEMLCDCLDTPCFALIEPAVCVYSCALYSCARVQSGSLYWWGVMPAKQRMKMIEYSKLKPKKHINFETKEIAVGSLVRIRSAPIFLADAVGFSMVEGYPQVGLLLDAVWSSTDAARFQVLPAMKRNDLNALQAENNASSAQSAALPENRKRSAVDRESYKERIWSVHSVVILEENRNTTVGKVKMIDGPYCAVAFADSSGKISENIDDARNWRLMRKDDLAVVTKMPTSSATPDYLIREPKKFEWPFSDHIFDIAIESNGLFAHFKLLLNNWQLLLLGIWFLRQRDREVLLSKVNFSGKIEGECVVCRDKQVFMDGITEASSQPRCWLVNCEEDSVIYVFDGIGCVTPILKTTSLKPADPLLFGSTTAFSLGMTSIAVGEEKVKTAVTLFSHRMDDLARAVISCDLTTIKTFVEEAEKWKAVDDLRKNFLSSRIGGNRNLLHACVAVSIPPTNRASESDIGYDDELYSPSMDYSAADATRVMFDSRWEHMIASSRGVSDVLKFTTRPPRFGDHRCVPACPCRCANSFQCRSDPLSACHVDNRSFCRRSFQAQVLWRTIQTHMSSCSDANGFLMEAIYPKFSRPDDSPLHVLACNDTCSFTWTADEHINQDIFECRTCGLVGSLCCCTECAFVCHKGHDCTLKRTSPTAYCDCWERCKCRSLIAGNQEARLELFRSLLNVPALHSKLNGRKEHIALFLARTLTRQIAEQRQFQLLRCKSECRSTANQGRLCKFIFDFSSSTLCCTVVRMPEYDLDPPRFAQKALDLLFSRWDVMESMIMIGMVEVDRVSRLSEGQFHLFSQDGVTFLDRFMYYLLVKLPVELLDVFLKTLAAKLVKKVNDADFKLILDRLIRSAVRIFALLNVSPYYMSSRKKCTPISRCRRLFYVLLPHAIRQLASTADGVLSLVRYGVVKATLPFSFPSSYDPTALIEKLFMIEPACFPRDGMTVSDKNFHVDPLMDIGQQDMPVLDAASEHDSDSDGGDGTVTRRTGDEAGTSTEPSQQRVTESQRETRTEQTNFSDTESDASYRPSWDHPEQEDDPPYTENNETGLNDGAEDDDDDDDDSDDASDLTYDEVNNEADYDSLSILASDIMRRRVDATSADSATRTIAAVKNPTDSGANRVDEEQRQNVSSADMLVTLARLFSTLLRETTALLMLALEPSAVVTNIALYPLALSEETISELEEYVEKRMNSTWQWLCPIMDFLESTIRLSKALDLAKRPTADDSSAKRDHASANSPQRLEKRNKKVSKTDAPISSQKQSEVEELRTCYSREAALGYLISVLRLHSCEHGEDVPAMDLASMKHVAIVADALLHSMNSRLHISSQQNGDAYCSVLYDMNSMDCFECPQTYERQWSLPLVGKHLPYDQQNPFFQVCAFIDDLFVDLFFLIQRSDSMIYPGLYPVRSALNHSSIESIPLASKPYLLLPTSSKETMFGIQRSLCSWDEHIVRKQISFFQVRQFFSFQQSMRSVGNLLPGSTSLSMHGDTHMQMNCQCGCCDASSGTVASSLLAKEREHLKCQPSMPRETSVIVHSKTIGEGEEPMDTSESTLVTPAAKRTALMENLAKNGRDRVQRLMTRWKFCLSAFARHFEEDLCSDASSFLFQMSGFTVKAQRFRKLIDRYRNSLAKDFALEVSRDRDALLEQTFRQLNMFIDRRVYSFICPYPMAVHRLKVSFKGEQGEGSGVVRSFYTCIANALLSPEPLSSALVLCSGMATTVAQPISRGRGREMALRRRALAVAPRRVNMSVEARSFVPGNNRSADATESTRQSLGHQLYPRVNALYPSFAPKLTGMLLELPPHQVLLMLSNAQMLRANCQMANDLLMNFLDLDSTRRDALAQEIAVEPKPSSSRCSSCPNLVQNGSNAEEWRFLADGYFLKLSIAEDSVDIDRRPLFFQPCNNAYQRVCSPKLSIWRLFFRLIALCLLHNEIMPLPLCRSVFKFILGRPVNWYDLAFYDLTMFDNFYKLARGQFKPEDLHLTFTLTLHSMEGGQTIPLIPNGENIPVTSENVVEYVYNHVTYRLITASLKALENIRDGVHDVLPAAMLDGLTAEDFRLLLTGATEVNTKTLEESTIFMDETSANHKKLMQPEKLAQFKRWFWSLVHSMTSEEKQELINFWTGSPALPASPDGPHPVPNVVIRPADDNYLPTANTCISRLYIPLYSSRAVLKQKLMMAIKVDTFGFV
ncbi:E3 ubiquitin protein ligase UBR5 [Trichuris trichiura]|uniref:E3 ubiquitin protein ligase UBR5 n=1 Tax=Trichuris trichiura TaxID=36087 RepID=A0A077Z1U8_TRITR|nr:E3 ubiquitin protein ligase UBR5 [Trichuris trichiura]